MLRKSNYDKIPLVRTGLDETGCWKGWPSILERIRESTARGSRRVICLECYPGVFEESITRILSEGLHPTGLIRTSSLLKSSDLIETMLTGILSDDPVFGRMNDLQISDFFDDERLIAAANQAKKWDTGLLIVVGTGASLVAPNADVLIYADMARWEIQKRQRSNSIGNFGADNRQESPALKYKRAFFVDWRAADRLKLSVYSAIDFWLDTNSEVPKMVTADCMQRALERVVRQPFRVVPFFDPGPWGGHWMEEVCDLPRDLPNYAWCFDCVPEENSLLLGFGSISFEIPANNLTLFFPRELLGEGVYSLFGTEFPIRFDFLDTMGGGNLSLQVHPKPDYIRDQFGMKYTQDESYYLLDAGEGGCVYLGLKEDIDRDTMIRELRQANEGLAPFEAQRFVNTFPAKKHDHFLIPAGTIHCSGKNSMVLEISATPYIFTFKLWDWNRVGLNGLPRPIHLDHGLANIDWSRSTEWVRRNLVNRIEPIEQGPNWTAERTGLHSLEFIETHRHWFSGATPHRAMGTVNVLNLVSGEEAIIESPTGAFEPFIVHYAETFIVPAAAGEYTISPHGSPISTNYATIKAFVRGTQRS